MLFTVNQVKNGVGVGWNSLKVDDLARKVDVPTKTEFVELQNVVGDKLDKNPPHTHEMTQIKELSNTLDTKLDKNKKYNYSSILENPEAIDYLTTVQTTKMEIVPSQNVKGYNFNVDSVGDLQIVYDKQLIGNYRVVDNKWLMGGIDVKGVLENHAAAITKISEGGVSTSDLNTIVIDLVYPVGAIYMTTSTKSPAEQFSNTTWELISDNIIYASPSTNESGTNYTLGTTTTNYQLYYQKVNIWKRLT